MAKKKKTRVPKTGPVWKQTAEEATLAKMPRYNAYACGHGAHGDAKYNRAKSKRMWKQNLEADRARNRGPYLYASLRARVAASSNRNYMILRP